MEDSYFAKPLPEVCEKMVELLEKEKNERKEESVWKKRRGKEETRT